MMSDTVELHTLEIRQPFAGNWGNWYGECSCHNPDGEGFGRMDWLEDNPQDVYDFWYDHYITVVQFADGGVTV